MPDDGLLPDQRGTLFPEMNGGAPGELDGGSDITGQVLPPLTDPDDPLAAGVGSSLSLVPGGAGPADAADAPAQVAGGQIEPPAQRRPRSAADRIAQLTKQYRQEQRARGEQEAQLSEALALLRQQGAEIQQLRSGRPPARAANEAADALGLVGTPIEGQAAPQLSLDAIRGVVREEVSGYERRNAEIRQLMASQEQAFKEACEEMPELEDRRSRAREIFDQIYSVSPLSKLPDAPYQIALQVQGILAGEARQQVSPQRKVQAGVVVPSTGSVDLPDSQRANARKEFDRLTEQRRRGNEDFQVYKRWRTLREQLRQRR